MWKRSQSVNVYKYEFKIKKEEEKAKSFIVDDVDKDHDVYCRDEVVFTVPFEFEEGVEYKINIYR